MSKASTRIINSHPEPLAGRPTSVPVPENAHPRLSLLAVALVMVDIMLPISKCVMS